MATIAWIGLGHMGAPMAGNLVAAGHEVRGVDPVPAAPCGGRRSRRARRRHDRRGGRRRRCGVHLAAAQRARARGATAATAASGRRHRARRCCSTRRPSMSRRRGSATRHPSLAGFRFVDSPDLGRHRRRRGRHADVHARRRGRRRRARRPTSSSRWPGTSSRSAARRWASPRSSRTTSCSSSRCSGVAEGSQLAAELGLDAETFFEVASVSSGDSWPLRTWYPAPGVVPTSPANRNFDATFTTRARREGPLVRARRRRRSRAAPAGRAASHSSSSSGSSPRGTAARTAASS